ncbi:ROK family protein [Solimicrobium silvestre]|uniref:ROK family protein n=1 Tax=Solimicrobium silvestre TaxID=2099400 RepID=UPI0013FE0B65|nr:ROK family protein [Solimicrobium silvestre]
MQKVVVFDIGGSNSRIALFDGDDIVWRDQAATPGQQGPDAMVARMVELYLPTLNQRLLNLDVNIGVAITGQIVDGCVTAHNAAVLPGWQSYPLQKVLSEKLQRSVRIVNDARAAAWGEYLYGTGRGVDEFLFLTVSTGVGAGLVLNRRLHIARNGFDAEIGEMKTADGATLEEHASGTALGRLALEHGYAGAKSLCDAADLGDSRATELVENGIREIAKKLADLAVMLGIQRVAVGGSVGLRAGYIERLRSEVAKYPPIYQVELVAAALGHDAGLVGVAALARSV